MNSLVVAVNLTALLFDSYLGLIYDLTKGLSEKSSGYVIVEPCIALICNQSIIFVQVVNDFPWNGAWKSATNGLAH